MRELKESPYTDTATKNPNFVNGRWLTLTPDENESPSRNNNNNLNPLQGDVDKEEVDPEDVKVEVVEKLS